MDPVERQWNFFKMQRRRKHPGIRLFLKGTQKADWPRNVWCTALFQNRAADLLAGDQYWPVLATYGFKPLVWPQVMCGITVIWYWQCLLLWSAAAKMSTGLTLLSRYVPVVAIASASSSDWWPLASASLLLVFSSEAGFCFSPSHLEPSQSVLEQTVSNIWTLL